MGGITHLSRVVACCRRERHLQRRLTHEEHLASHSRPPSRGTLPLAGCTAAAASSTAAASGTAKAGAGNPASAPGLTHVIAYSINTDNPVLTSVVSGAIGDYGPAEEELTRQHRRLRARR